MVKPEAFQHQYTTLNTLPYSCVGNDRASASFSGGVLRRGETVWVEWDARALRRPKDTVAYVEGVGLITLNAERLIRADALKPLPEETHA